MKILSAWLLLWVSLTALAQSELTVTGDALLSGSADTQIRTFARQAAQDGKRLQVSAPGYWHAQIREQIDAAAPQLSVGFTDVFNEVVIIRAEAAAPVAPAPPEEPPEPPRETPPPPPIAPPKQAVAAPVAPVRVPDATIAPAPAAPPPLPTVVDPKVAAREASLKRLSEQLNEGQAISDPINLARLEVNDQIAIDGDTAVVVRQLRLHRQIFVLDEPLGRTDRSELERGSTGVFIVRSRFSTALIDPAPAAATEPALTAADELKLFERRFNSGQPFAETIDRSALQLGDVLYVGAHHIVAVRPERIRLQRFLLDGPLDLESLELETQAANRYKLLEDPR
jgi:hypothetical protein